LSDDGDEPRTKVIVTSLIGGVVGGLAIAAIFVGVHSVWPRRLMPNDMPYQDLAAVLLTSVAVIVTVLGVSMAILAVWGYASFERIAKKAARDYVKSDLKNGKLKQQVEILAVETMTRYMDEAMGDQGKLRLMLEARLDRALLAGGGSSNTTSTQPGIIDPDEDDAAIIDPDEGDSAVIDPDDGDGAGGPPPVIANEGAPPVESAAPPAAGAAPPAPIVDPDHHDDEA
jgi:hypothetical protein